MLRWFISIALRIYTGHDFRVISAPTWARARTKRKLDSEEIAPFLFNEHGDPHFLFLDFNENTVNNWEKINRNLWLLFFWQMKINTTGETKRAQQRISKLCFPLKDEKCRVFEDIFSGV